MSTILNVTVHFVRAIASSIQWLDWRWLNSTVMMEKSCQLILNINTQRLFELKTHQIVVVRGRARTNELGNLIVAANGLYVRR